MTIALPETFAPQPFAPIHQGEYSVKIADSQQEVIAAQELRYEVFCENMGAGASDEAHKLKRDGDAFDAVCDHLLVRYHPDDESAPRVVGTYRLLRDVNMTKIGRYYSESEYDITKIKTYDGNVMELGRSCTHPEFRSKVAMQLLWRGIGEYVMHYNVGIMFGCASFPGDNPDEHAAALTYLYHKHRAPDDICPRTLEQYYVALDRMDIEEIDEKRTFFKLPVLIKGYLRLGGVIGDGAFLDHDFNTTDILVVVQTDKVSDKYVTKYAPDSVQGGDA
jgi:putative hemolysin